MNKHETNGMDGESHFTLCVDDLAVDQPVGELCACFIWNEAGSDNEPMVHLISRDRDNPQTAPSWNYIMPVSQLRRLCDMAEAAHKFGLVQWREIGGVRDEEVSDAT